MAVHESHPIRLDLSDMGGKFDVPWIDLAWNVVENVYPDCPFEHSFFSRISGAGDRQSNLMSALTFLSSSANTILDLKLYMIGKDQSRVILDPARADAVISGNPVEHPETGEIVEKPAESTYLAYIIRDSAFQAAPDQSFRAGLRGIAL